MSDYARRLSNETTICKCGCGTVIPKYDKKGREKNYVKGHQRKGKPFSACNMKNLSDGWEKETKLCGCGCGEEILKYNKQRREIKFKNGHQTKGENHPMFGKQHSEETKAEYSRVRKGRVNPEHLREQTKQRNLENWKDPEYREKMCNILNENSDKIKDDPRYSEIHSERMKEKWKDGTYNFHVGKEISQEHKDKLRETQEKLWSDPDYYESKIGENSPNWRGGISQNSYCDIWKDREYKNDIKERDEFKCQNPFCYGKSNRLSIHHIDYNKENCNPKNLITLCVSCNTRANSNREQWKAVYLDIIEEMYA